MLTFKCKKNGEPFEVVFYQYVGKESPPDVRDTVNAVWENLLRDPNVTDLKGLLPDGSVMMPPVEKPMTWGVWGKYRDRKDGKATLYPFECEKPLKEGQEFLSMPNGVPAITTVVACRWVERKLVVAACKGHRLFKITHIVNHV